MVLGQTKVKVSGKEAKRKDFIRKGLEGGGGFSKFLCHTPVRPSCQGPDLQWEQSPHPETRFTFSLGGF